MPAPTAAPLWTLKELAQHLGEHYDTTARKVRLGLIPVVLIPTATGRRPRKRFNPDHIDAMLNSSDGRR